MKKLLIFLFATTIFIAGNSAFAATKNKWESVKVHKILDNEHILLFDRRVVKIIGINGLDFDTKNRQDICYARPTFRLMKTFLEGKEIKILADKIHKTKMGKFPRHIKMPDKKNFTEFLLANGMAKFQSDGVNVKYDKNYEKAETKGIQNEAGIWGKCGNREIFEIRRKSSQKAQNFRKKYGSFLAPVSVGKVKKVISGKFFQLENGVKIKVLGIETPAPDDFREGFACFGKSAKSYLESLILGKKVILRKDITNLDENWYLPRYIFLPKTKTTPRIFVNQVLVSDGYAQSKWKNKKDVYFKKEIELAQDYVLQNPQGAWKICLSELMKDKTTAKKALKFDEECPIKGNISGSKKNPIKKYHTPSSRWYKRLKYERCFENEKDATEAGFVKVK